MPTNPEVKKELNSTIESLKLHDAYKHLSVDTAVKTAIGGVIGGLLLYRFPSGRKNLACLGAGMGLGYSLKEVNLYLKNPTVERLPNTIDQFNKSKDTANKAASDFWAQWFPRKGSS